MNAHELKLHLDNTEYKPCNSEISYVTLPLVLLSQKLLTKIALLLNEKYDLSNSELDVLASFYSSSEENITLTPTELYEKLLFSSGGMTKVLKKLEKKEFIVRLDNKVDKRSKLVQVTQSGRDIMEKALVDVVELEEALFAHVNTDEKKSLSDLLFKAFE